MLIHHFWWRSGGEMIFIPSGNLTVKLKTYELFMF